MDLIEVVEEFIEIEFREDLPVERQILAALNRVARDLHTLKYEVWKMSTTAVTKDQLDAALQNLLQAEAARDAAVTQALTDLQEKISAGGVPTPADFAAELAIITTLQTNAAALTQTATADDPGPTAVTPPAAPTS